MGAQDDLYGELLLIVYSYYYFFISLSLYNTLFEIYDKELDLSHAINLTISFFAKSTNPHIKLLFSFLC